MTVSAIVGHLQGYIFSTPFTVLFFVLFFFQQNMKCFHSSSFSLDTDTVEVKCNYLMLCYTKLAGMLKHNMCSSQQTYCHQFRITL